MKNENLVFDVWSQGDESVGIPNIHFTVEVKDLDLTKLDPQDAREYITGLMDGLAEVFAKLNDGNTTVFPRSGTP